MASPKVLVLQPKFGKLPHNGWDETLQRGRKDQQFKDPVTGAMIGGQVAYIRTAMRFPRFVAAWARRQGKTTTRPHLYREEQTVTPGMYWAGMLFPDHTVAHRTWESFKQEWGQLVVDAKGDDKSQNRWVRLMPIHIPKEMPAPLWFGPRLRARWDACKETPNEGATIYFWSGQHPYYRRIQGATHYWNRISPDEAQQIHPGWRKILMPMLRDTDLLGRPGFLDVSGTPDVDEEGNEWFEEFFLNGNDPAMSRWACLRFPDGTNPHVPPDSGADEDLGSEDAIRQARYAEFLSDQGAVFKNIDSVFSIPYRRVEGTDHPLWPAWLHDLNRRFPLPTALAWFARFDPVPRHIYGVSVDWSRSPRGDRTVVSVMNFTTGRQDAVFCWRGEDFNEQMEWVLAIQQHYRAEQAHCDNNGMGEPMADFMRRRHARGYVGHKFGKNKADYVRKAQVLFMETGRESGQGIALIDCETQKREFKSFRAKEPDGADSESTIRYTHRPGGHDDFVAAFLQIAPTLTIVGRQQEEAVAVEDRPAFDDKGRTTLSLFGDDVFEERDLEPEWRTVRPSLARQP